MRKCLGQEELFELATLGEDKSLWRRWRAKLHAFRCTGCRENIARVRNHWQQYLTPEPEIASSLVRVFSRLQKDETLILKGWKLGDTQAVKRTWSPKVRGEWFFRGAVSLGLASTVVLVVVNQFQSESKTLPVSTAQQLNHTPLAQIRMERKNGVEVHYVRPELLQSIEFETTNQP